MRTVCTLAVCLLVCGCSGKKEPATLTYKEVVGDWSKWEGKTVRMRGKASNASLSESSKVIYVEVRSGGDFIQAVFPESDAAHVMGLNAEVTIEGVAAERLSPSGLRLTGCKLITGR